MTFAIRTSGDPTLKFDMSDEAICATSLPLGLKNEVSRSGLTLFSIFSFNLLPPSIALCIPLIPKAPTPITAPTPPKLPRLSPPNATLFSF